MVSNSSTSGGGEPPVVTLSSLPNGGTEEKSSDDSTDNVIIAVSVIVPLVALVLILVGGYFWYRRRYPVRMIIGRDVSKFINPKYAQPKKQATLVRNDAENFFNQPNDEFEDCDTVTLEMNPASARWQPYDNPGYQRDETEDIGICGVKNYDDEEEEEERRFREKKSWLFRRSDDKGVVEKSRGNAEDVDSIDSSHSEIDVSDKKMLTDSKSGKSGLIKNSTDRNSIASDVSELLNEQQPTPKRARRGLSRETTTESSSTSESVGSTHSATVHDEKSALEPFLKEDTGQSTDEDKNSSVVQNTEKDLTAEKEESNFMKTVKVIFQQPSLEQVMAEVKARSRSMSVGTLKVDMNTRQRSYSVDPSKSARKCSLHDETILAAYARSVAARKILETPISSASSHHSMDSPKQPLTAQSSLSASIVGVDIKVKMSSGASTGSGGSSISIYSIDGSDGEERHRGLSLASTNSNPHLLTDLDNISQNSEGGTKPSEIEEEPGMPGMTDQEQDVQETIHVGGYSDKKEIQPGHNLDSQDGVVEHEPGKLGSEENQINELTFNTPTESAQEKLERVNYLPGHLETNTSEDCKADKTLETTKVLGPRQNSESSLDSSPILEVVHSQLQENNSDSKYDDANLLPLDSSRNENEIVLLHEKQAENQPTGAVVVSSLNVDPLSELYRDTDEHVTQQVLVPSEDQKVIDKGQISSATSAVSTPGGDGKRQEKIEDGQEEMPNEGSTEKIDSTLTHTSHDPGDYGDREADIEIQKKPVPASRTLSRQNNVEDDLPSSDEDSSNENSSETSGSNGNGTEASYDFGNDDDNEKSQNKEHGDDNGTEDNEQNLEDPSIARNLDLTTGSTDELSPVVHTSRSDSLDSESHHTASTSAADLPDYSVNLISETSPKRVKILPPEVSISDDDDSGEYDEDKAKYKFSDDDISDILGSSSDDSESRDVAQRESPDCKNFRASSPTTYTFQSNDSDDDDIDV